MEWKLGRTYRSFSRLTATDKYYSVIWEFGNIYYTLIKAPSSRIRWYISRKKYSDSRKPAPYCPQGNSVSERLHATMHTMLDMHTSSSMKQENWLSLLPFVQAGHNTSSSTMVHETPCFLVFRRQAQLPVRPILDIPHEGTTADTHMVTNQTRENLQLAFDLARQNF